MYVIEAVVPLSEMFGYVTALRSLSSGRGMFTMQFAHYQSVDMDIAERTIRDKGKGEKG